MRFGSKFNSVPHDEREATRLDLVGLAAEIAAVAQYVQSRLLPEGYSPRADAVRQRCLSFLRAADQVLCVDSPLHHLGQEELVEAVLIFRELQRKLKDLRPSVERATDTMLG